MKLWLTLCAVIIALVATGNIGHVVRRVPPPPHSALRLSQDLVMQHERRFTAVREALQARAVKGLVGYVADVPPAELTKDDGAMQEYFVTQFVLAPWVLEAKFDDCGWAVTNFRRAATPAVSGFERVQDFGSGVFLLRRVPR